MKKSAIHKTICFVLTVSFLLLGGASVLAQDVNLLTNPGFEDPYTEVSGSPPRQVAQGWTPWHMTRTDDMATYENTQPEYAAVAPDTTRIRNGSNAQVYSSFFATHDGGLFQRVTGITSGTELRFSVYAYVWSTTFDDRFESEEDGDVVLRVGIDPTGGTDGTSSNIVWSTPIEQYDAYREYSVITKATSSAVTVFIRSTVGFPVQNNYIYVDDAVLAPTTESPVAASDTPASSTATPLSPTATKVSSSGNQNTATSVATLTFTPTMFPTFTPSPLPTTAVPQEASPTQEGLLATATPLALATATPISSGEVKPISDTFPSTVVHTVQSGDTVGYLATLYDSSIEAIIEANGLDSNALIYTGQGLVIPVRVAGVDVATPTLAPVVIVVTATQSGTISTVDTTQNLSNAETLYIIQRGDNLSALATKFNTTVAALAQLNGIVNPDRISTGQSLLVPGAGVSSTSTSTVSSVVVVSATVTPVPSVVVASSSQDTTTTYMVLPGDNLFRISLRFNVSMLRLIEANDIANPNRIFAGQIMVIPS